MNEYGYHFDVLGVVFKYFLVEQFFWTFVNQGLDIPAILQPRLVLNPLGDFRLKHQ